ncbi:D-alanyl-D-alanine dipeptidase [Bradyrhizobium sp. Ghvi]|uniref:D-alanyl-D-alanine dipeptidase n=1 Tax=Bradyrhizobium sp. Ghvi TaxID=1855319 RepID=UPI0008F3D86F|nr:D-alanyl-D-alanine dipeptidase [Bradyrhizobium sp. Ghvi]SFO19114.1 D-alanyl-D-alanine dipeptidase [Bradyrhizobium sp. Ghvi]
MLVSMTEEGNITLDIRYASSNNILGRPIYKRSVALLVPEAHRQLLIAAERAKALGLGVTVYDAFRPLEAQWIFWDALEDKTFVGDPRLGGTHPRGIAVDLTLSDLVSGKELEMGTAFDALTSLSGHHALEGLPADAIRNRAILLGIMTATGWAHYGPEWWHYNLPNIHDYEPLAAADVPQGPM